MPAKALDLPRWKIICAISLLCLGAASIHAAETQISPSSTAPAYGGAATQGGPGSMNAATGQPVEPAPPPPGMRARSQQSEGQTQGQPGISNADRNLMRTLAQIHLAEVDMGKMAQTRSQDVQVRSFAQRMIDDHGKALEELRKLAEAKGVILPNGPNKKHAAVKEKLTAMTGDQFSAHYLMQAGDAAHREAHQILQQAAQTAQDPELKTHASHSLALVEQHLRITNHLMAKNQSRFKRQQMEGAMGGPMREQAGGQPDNQATGQVVTPSAGSSQAIQQQSSAPPARQEEVNTAPGSAPR